MPDDIRFSHDGEAFSLLADRLLIVEELATLLRCDPETVKRRARAGTLPGFKIGKFWYFRQSDIDRMIAAAVQSRRATCAAVLEDH